MISQLKSKRLNKPRFQSIFFGILTVFLLLFLRSIPVEADTTRVCDPQIYHGIMHCTDDGGNTHLLLVDLSNPHVRVQTVLPINPVSGEECNSVNGIDRDGDPLPSNCPYPYPFETITSMLNRYITQGAVAIINTDYFGCGGAFPCGGDEGDHGAQGLAVRNGIRLDGPLHGVTNSIAYTSPSLAISSSKIATIAIPGTQSEIDNNLLNKYYNTVGGTPLLISNGQVVTNPCDLQSHPYGDTCSSESQSAVGIANDGRMILITADKNAVDIANYLKSNHFVQTALKFDGGGSAQLAWVGDDGSVQNYDVLGRNRPVAEGLLIFSDKIQPSNNVDVALIIDSSGSMSWNDPRNKRLDAAKAYLTGSYPGDYVGVIDFDSSARVASPMLLLPDYKDSLVDAINTIDSSGGTNIGVGIQLACTALRASFSENSIKGAILLTDGEGSFANQDICFKDRGWPIYTFGFGSANENLLRQIATNTGGEFTWLPTTDLVCEFQRVRAKIAGVVPGPCTVYHVGPLEITIFTIVVPTGQAQVTFSTSWSGSDVELSLISPSGRIINRTTIDPDVIHDLGLTYEIFTVLNPEPGEWNVSLYGVDVPLDGEDVVFGFTTIPASNQPPTINTPGDQISQYSDPIYFNVSGIDPNDNSDSLIFSAQDLPAFLTLVDNFNGTAAIYNTTNAIPGIYNISITVTDPGGLTASKIVSVNVNQDSRATYTGPMLVSTACATCNTATIPLRATIQDITAVPGDPAYDPDPGDITNATVTFVDRRTATPLCTASLALLDPGDLTTGTATCDWTADIGNNMGLDYTIGIVVDGYYTRDSSEDDVVVVVSKPGDNFITGGGYLINQSSGGTYAGDIGLKTNFGLNLKFNKTKTNIQGKVNLIVRQAGHVYQISSTAFNSLVVNRGANGGPGTAELLAKARIVDITDPLAPISILGNATLQVTLKDYGEPGNLDLMGITLWSKNGQLLFSSNWNGVKTMEQALDGGNIQIHVGASLPSPLMVVQWYELFLPITTK